MTRTVTGMHKARPAIQHVPELDQLTIAEAMKRAAQTKRPAQSAVGQP